MKYILISIVYVVIFSTIARGQGFLQNTGLNVETIVGRISAYNVEGTQYGLRVGAWPRSWLNVGLETFIANNLWNERTYYDRFRSQKGQFDFSRSHVFVGFHLRIIEYIKPYTIGTFGRSKEPNRGISGEESNDFSYLKKNSFTLKIGLAFEIQRVRLAIETGGGNMGTGHSETNMSLSYSLKRLPTPTQLSKFTVTSGLHNFTALTGPYRSEDITGFDINLEVEKNGKIREYNAGIFFTQDDHFSTGVFNLGIGWHINNNQKLSDFIDVIPGVQLLIWAEGSDFILPAASLGLSSQYQLLRLVLFVKVRALATYSRNNGFISGLTSTYGVGLAF